MKNKRIAVYCRVGNAEDSQKIEPFQDITKYEGYYGFEDLRNFDLPEKIFKKLWKYQDTLYNYSKQKNYLKNNNPILWNNMKRVSGEYQRILLIYKYKNNKIKDDIEIEK